MAIFCSPKRFWLGNSLTILLLFVFTFLDAQENFSPDRPGFSSGTHTVDPGSLYLEIGYQYSFSSNELAPDFHNLPLTNIRYGLAEKFEVNLFWSGFEASSNSNGISTSDNFGVGAKYSLIETDQYNISLLGKISFQGLAGDFEAIPLIAGLWNYKLPSNFGAFGVVNLAYNNNQKLFTELSLGLSYSISDEVGIIGEYYNSIDLSPMAASHNLGFGITYLIANSIQLDANFGSGLGANAYRFIGCGLSKKF